MIHYLIVRYKRGKITPLTTNEEFAEKAKEELNEWIKDFNPNEAVDLIMVLINWMIHRKFFVTWYYVKNIYYQLTRKN